MSSIGIASHSVQRLEADRIKSAIAMSVFLVSLSMLFATLILGFVVYRLSSEYWPPMGMERPPLFIPLLSTFCIVASSLTYEFYVKALRGANLKLAKIHFSLTFLLGLGFLFSQAFLWTSLKEMGYLVDTGVFASMLHSFTWVHAVHIVMGLFWLLYLIPTVRLGATYQRYEIRVSNAGKFWHFLDIVWLVLFVVLFVV